MSNTNTPRTRLSWFAMFPEPYRTQAIENYDEDCNGYNGQSLFDDAADALDRGFYWEKSLQGFDYWVKFHDKLERNEITLTVPAEEVEATPDYEAIVKELVEMVSVKVSGDGDYYTGKQHAYNGILDFIKSKTESK